MRLAVSGWEHRETADAMSSHPYPMQSAATRSFVISPLSPCHRAHVPPGLSHQPNQYFHTITIAAVSSSQYRMSWRRMDLRAAWSEAARP